MARRKRSSTAAPEGKLTFGETVVISSGRLLKSQSWASLLTYKKHEEGGIQDTHDSPEDAEVRG